MSLPISKNLERLIIYQDLKVNTLQLVLNLLQITLEKL